jgi:hypothetical protein
VSSLKLQAPSAFVPELSEQVVGWYDDISISSSMSSVALSSPVKETGPSQLQTNGPEINLEIAVLLHTRVSPADETQLGPWSDAVVDESQDIGIQREERP